ncbi:MAG: hypothetical protein AAF851_11085 [Myxococcota bacterium]
MRAALRLQRVGAPQAAEAKARELDTPPEPKLGPVLTKRLRNYFLRKQGQLTTPSRHAVSISASGRKLVDLWKDIRELRNRLKREAFQWAREALFLQKAEAYLRVTEPVIERLVASQKPSLEPRRKAAALVLRFEEVGARQVVRVRGAKRRRPSDGAVLYRDARGRGLVLEEPGRITVLHEEARAARIAEAVLNGKRTRGLRLEEEGDRRDEVRSDAGHAEVEAKRAERARHALRVLSGERVDAQRRERAVLLQGHPARHLRQPEPESADPNQGVRRVRGSDDGRSDGGGRLERRDHVTELPDAVEGLSSDEVPKLVMEALRRPEPKVLEVDDEMVLEVRSVGQGEGLELGRANELTALEPQAQRKLEVKPPEPEMKETEPPPPAAPPTCEDEAQKRKRQRLEKTSRVLREAERQRVLDAVKGGAKELELIAAKAKLSERVCKRRLGELERDGSLQKTDGLWGARGLPESSHGHEL